MNWVLIAVLAVMGGFAALGYWKGLLRIVYSLVSGILVVIFVTWASPFIKDYIINNTDVSHEIAESCEEVIRQNTKTAIDTGISSANIQNMDVGLALPDAVVDTLLERAASATQNMAEASGVYEMAAEGAADFIIQGISFFAALLLASTVSFILSRTIGIVSKIPVINGVNRLSGLLLGLVNGLLIVWIGFYFAAVCSATEQGQYVIENIYQNPFLVLLYENNLLLIILMHFL